MTHSENTYIVKNGHFEQQTQSLGVPLPQNAIFQRPFNVHGHTSMLKNRKLSWTQIREKYGAVMKLMLPEPVKDCRSFWVIINFL